MTTPHHFGSLNTFARRNDAPNMLFVPQARQLNSINMNKEPTA